MSCGHCEAERSSAKSLHEKTLYDRTLARRLRSRRATRGAAALVALGLLMGSAAASLAPAQAGARAAAYGGFGSMATASPLKIEFFEPAIPIPTEPQFEIDFSYTRVLGDSGPTTTARASALWPGPAIGEGMKTFGEALKLPPALTEGGYPVQVNAGYPGETGEASSEQFPGMVQRVKADEKRTVAKAGYTASGDLAEGDPDGSVAPANPVDPVTKGDLAALGGILTGSATGAEQEPAPSSPTGALSAVIDFDGMTSVSSSVYDGDKVVSTATSRLGELRLIGGLVTLNGVNVVTRVTSTLDAGAKTSQTVHVGSMTIAGQKFAHGPDGFVAAGNAAPIPGMPAQGAELLELLGIAVEVPKPVVSREGAGGSIAADGVVITLDTRTLRSKVPALPLDELVAQLPDLKEGNILKGMLVSLNTFAPKVVLHLGSAAASATTVPAFDFAGGTPPASSSGASGAAGSTGGTAGTAGTAGEIPPAAETPTTSTPVEQVSAVPGLPPLGSIPTMLALLGALLAGGAGWYLRRAGGLLFGAGATCTHGLKAGIPDLRKA